MNVLLKVLLSVFYVYIYNINERYWFCTTDNNRKLTDFQGWTDVKYCYFLMPFFLPVLMQCSIIQKHFCFPEFSWMVCHYSLNCWRCMWIYYKKRFIIWSFFFGVFPDVCDLQTLSVVCLSGAEFNCHWLELFKNVLRSVVMFKLL